MRELVAKVGVCGILKAIWDIICLFIRSVINKTDVLTEYQKDCDNNRRRIMDIISETEEGRELLAKCKELHGYS
jgi:hypothetical protein